MTELSIDRIKFLWNKLKDFDTLFNDFVKGDFQTFINHFIVMVDGEPRPAGLFWDVDDVGMFVLNDIKPGDSAQAHFLFWDKRFRGREKLCREMLAYLFLTYNFRRIWVEVPLHSYWTIRAVERLGFVHEGRKRKATLWKGEWYDTNIYSILPEDLLLPMPKSGDEKKVSTRTICSSCGDVHNKERFLKPREEASHGA